MRCSPLVSLRIPIHNRSALHHLACGFRTVSRNRVLTNNGRSRACVLGPHCFDIFPDIYLIEQTSVNSKELAECLRCLREEGVGVRRDSYCLADAEQKCLVSVCGALVGNIECCTRDIRLAIGSRNREFSNERVSQDTVLVGKNLYCLERRAFLGRKFVVSTKPFGGGAWGAGPGRGAARARLGRPVAPVSLRRARRGRPVPAPPRGGGSPTRPSCRGRRRGRACPAGGTRPGGGPRLSGSACRRN